MNRKILFIILILISLVGCTLYTTEPTSNKEPYSASDVLRVYTKCDDKVICYFHDGGNSAGGMTCLRDNDLYYKYCDGEIR